MTNKAKIGRLPVEFALGARYYAETPEGGRNWGTLFCCNASVRNQWESRIRTSDFA